MAQSPLGKILSLIQSPDGDLTPSIRSKAVYCLSGALNHNRSAVQELEGLGGWKVLNYALAGMITGIVQMYLPSCPYRFKRCGSPQGGISSKLVTAS